MKTKPAESGSNIIDLEALRRRAETVVKKAAVQSYESVLSGARFLFADVSPRGLDPQHPVRLARGVIGRELAPTGSLDAAAQRLADTRLRLEGAEMRLHHLGGELDTTAAALKLLEDEGIV